MSFQESTEKRRSGGGRDRGGGLNELPDLDAPQLNINPLYGDDDLGGKLADAATTRNQTVQLLYSQDHMARARALEAELPEAKADLVVTPPKAIPNLETLTFWGHGDQYKLCHQTPSELAELVKQWKALNPSLHTVELITCNARQFKPNQGKGDSFASAFKSQLGGVRSSTRNLLVKALPTTVTGKQNAWSILLAEPGSKSWVYVTAPGADDSMMMQAQNLIRYEMEDGGFCSFSGDIAARADKVVRDHPDRKWTMNYGYFNNLRKCLGVVR